MTTRILTAAICLVLAATAFADPPKDHKKFAKHLEKEGDYDTETSDSFLTARHEEQLNIVLKAYRDGVLVQTYVETGDQEFDDIIGRVNSLNANATVAKFYIDGDGDTMIEAWYPGEYEKDTFENFLEAWQADTKGQGAAILELVQ